MVGAFQCSDLKTDLKPSYIYIYIYCVYFCVYFVCIYIYIGRFKIGFYNLLLKVSETGVNSSFIRKIVF